MYSLDVRLRLDQAISVPIIRALLQNPAKDKDAMMFLGEILYSFTYATTDDDMEAEARMSNGIEAAVGDASDKLRQALMSAKSIPMLLAFAAHWADQAFPQLEVGQKYAAALMATKLSDPAILSDIKPPWRAFLLEVPPGLLPVDSVLSGGVSYVSRIFVNYRRTDERPEGYWALIMSTSDGTEIWRNSTAAKLLSDDQSALGLNDESENRGAYDFDTSDRDNRTALLATRLVFGLCLAMSNPANVQPIGRAKSSPNIRPKGQRIPPQTRVFRVGKPITLDVRQTIQNFAIHGPSRKGSTPSLQHLVRGHWKPRLAARLGHPVWIEPYYRGPEDAPLIMPRRTSRN